MLGNFDAVERDLWNGGVLEFLEVLRSRCPLVPVVREEQMK